MLCVTVQIGVKFHYIFLRNFTIRVVVFSGVTPCNFVWSYIFPSYDISLYGWLPYVVCTVQFLVKIHLPFLRHFTVWVAVLCVVTPCNMVRSKIWPPYDISLWGWLSYAVWHCAIWCEVSFGLLTIFHCSEVCFMWCVTVQFGVKIHLAFLRYFTLRVVVLCVVTTCDLLWKYICLLTIFHCAGGFLAWCVTVQFGVKIHLASYHISLCAWLSYVVWQRAICCEVTFGLLRTFQSASGCLIWWDTLQFGVKLHLVFLRYFTVRVVVICGVSPCYFLWR
jgi:hypothetical protein